MHFQITSADHLSLTHKTAYLGFTRNICVILFSELTQVSCLIYTVRSLFKDYPPPPLRKNKSRSIIKTFTILLKMICYRQIFPNLYLTYLILFIWTYDTVNDGFMHSYILPQVCNWFQHACKISKLMMQNSVNHCRSIQT